MIGLTSIRTSSKTQGAAVVHVPHGCSKASLLYFEEVLETGGYCEENLCFLQHLEMASKACLGLVRLVEAEKHMTK